ncbi:MAG TPA: M20/M25/M40 family metallo-hydrolase, partial [Sphingobacterium sp.]|nr:M20/M25/M40 family metallo-hydrolase [Sphingobacterium sp.]
MICKTFFPVILLCLSQLFGYAQNVSDIERAIVQRVDSNCEASIEFLKTTVNINSGTMNPVGVQKVGKLYQQFLEELGFTTRWVEMPTSMNRGGHLIAEMKGNKGKSLMLVGHMDTVFEEDSPFQHWQKQDTIAYGPGATDMKGGNMVMLYSLKALKDAGQLAGRQITVVLHGDEESPGRPIDISRKDIIELAKRSDIALAYEPSTGFGYVTTARRSSSGWTLEVDGIQAHSSYVFSNRVGSGAIYETARILYTFHEKLREESLTYSPGLIVGGSDAALDSSGISGYASGKTNLVADVVIVKGDLRTISNEQLCVTRQKMETIVAESFPKTKARITFSDGYPAMVETQGNRDLLKHFSRVSTDLGLGEVQAYDP